MTCSRAAGCGDGAEEKRLRTASSVMGADEILEGPEGVDGAMRWLLGVDGPATTCRWAFWLPSISVTINEYPSRSGDRLTLRHHALFEVLVQANSPPQSFRSTRFFKRRACSHFYL